MSDTFPSDKAEKIVVRLPDGMRDRLAAAARVNKRSTNAEVVARLEWTFDEPEYDPTPEEREAARQAYMSGYRKAAEGIGETIASVIRDPRAGPTFGDFLFGDDAQRTKAAASLREALTPDEKKPIGPATDAVTAMDEAIGKDRKRRR